MPSPLASLLGIFHKFPVRETPAADLRGLLQTLHPVRGGRPLVRFGGTTDGGYLVPDCLDGITACFSPGIADSSRFEAECAARGMAVFMADYSVEGPAESHPSFHFIKKFVGATSNDTTITLHDWVADSVPATASELMLQIDIESCEYETLLAAPDALLRRFRIIVGEFHRLDHLWARPYFPFIARTFAKLLQTHACVHIHPNNSKRLVTRRGIAIPPNGEFTFVRRDFITDETPAREFPHPLDRDNTPHPPVILPRCWYHS